MKIFNIWYNNDDDIRDLPIKYELSEGHNCLIRIHTAFMKAEDSLDIAKKVKAKLPKSQIIGCSTSGIVIKNNSYESGALISILKFEYGSFITKLESIENLNINQIANNLGDLINENDIQSGFLFFGDSEYRITQIINELDNITENVELVGGVAGFLDKNGMPDSYVFDDKEIIYKGYATGLIRKDYILAYSNIVNGHPTIGETHTITKANGTYIEEIDGENAVLWINKHLGIKELEANSNWIDTVKTDILLRFPIILENDINTSRFLRYDADNNKISLYFSELSDNTKFKIGYLSSLKSVEQWQGISQDLQTVSNEVIIAYSCLFRKLFADNISKWEIEIFKDVEFSGAFMLGEIGSKQNSCKVLNGSTSILTLAEKENYLDYNLDAFSSIEGLINDNNAVIDQISLVQKTLNEANSGHVLNNLIEFETRMKNRINLANELKLKSFTQFILEQGDSLDKNICFMQIDNTNKLIDEYGEEKYSLYFKQNINILKNIMKTLFPKFNFNIYLYDHSSFFYTIERSLTSDRFINVSNEICNEMIANNFIEDFKTRFLITVKGYKIQALKQESLNLVGNKDLFAIENFKETMNESLNTDFKLVKIIEDAIQYDRVIPYFQGIYDNKNNRFYCYEALMRLQDENGKILFPNEFLDIAKKYDLYQPLSIKMVTQVLELFDNREEIITINISYYDVINPEFNEVIFAVLDRMENPRHFIFELVETERIEKPEVLRDFIHQAKKYGIKIAVDDFGAGYSNFIEIGNLDIDFIKINGSLTQLLGTDDSYNKILKSISYMGKEMKVKLIAEFVETAKVQKQLLKHGVHYSQGYLFSNPMSLEELYYVVEENKLNNGEEIETEEHDEIAINAKVMKKNNFIMIFSGTLIAFISVILIAVFLQINTREVNNINESYLIEITNGMSDKIGTFVNDLESDLLLTSVAISNVIDNEEMLSETLKNTLLVNDMDDIYIVLDDGNITSAINDPFNHNFAQLLNYSDINTVYIHSPMIETSTKRDVLLMSTVLVNQDGNRIGEVFAKYYLDTFGKKLNLKSFGSEAFFHLCDLNGIPIVLSGNSSNLFTNGDMYDFIDTLNIKNGHTGESIKEDMINNQTVILKYEVNNQDRLAVMMPIPNTDWCVISIILTEVNDKMVMPIINNILFFTVILALLLSAYFILNLRLVRNNNKNLLKALEASHYLSISLQNSIEKDSLTRVYSRATAVEKIMESIKKNANRQNLALVLLDIDNFKEINDTYGHQTGDVYLQNFVRIVRMQLKAEDILGRMGGDEFILLINDIESIENLNQLITEIIEQVSKISIKNLEFEKVGVSIGIALIPEHGTDYEKLNNLADKALYKVKGEGKNKFKIYDPTKM